MNYDNKLGSSKIEIVMISRHLDLITPKQIEPLQRNNSKL